LSGPAVPLVLIRKKWVYRYRSSQQSSSCCV